MVVVVDSSRMSSTSRGGESVRVKKKVLFVSVLYIFFLLIFMNFEHFVCRFFCGERYLSRASPLLFVYSIKSEQCTA